MNAIYRNVALVAYTGRTEIIGAEKDAQGLADTVGTWVRVEYSQIANASTATKIEVISGRGAK